MPYIGKQPVVGNFVKLDAIITSATDTFPLTNGGAAYTPQSVNQMIVSLNGVIQAPTDAFTLSGSNIVFASALTGSDVIDFILVFGDTLDIGVPSDDTVSAIKIKTNAITEAKINDGAVTETKLGSGSVTADKIGSGAVTTAKLGPAAVTASTIAPGTITTTQISPSVKLGVPVVASDPPAPSLSEGDLWVNTTDNKLKGWLTQSAAWSASYYDFGGIGTGSANDGPQTAGWVANGYEGATSPPRRNFHITFNGTTGSTLTGTPFYASGTGGSGTLSAHTIYGGHRDDTSYGATPIPPSYYAVSTAQSWNGSSWSAETSMPTNRSACDGSHLNTPETDFFVLGGWTPSGNPATDMIKYDGSTWTTGTSAPTPGRWGITGPTSDTLLGQVDGGTVTLEFDGSTFTTSSSIGSPFGGGSSLWGSTSKGYALTTPVMSTTYIYNGTTWSSSVTHPVTGPNNGSKTCGGSGDGYSYGYYIGGGPDANGSTFNFTGEGLGAVNIN